MNPRWLLALPDAIAQLEALDREVLTRRDLEQLLGVRRAHAATLMRTFGAGRTGNLRTLQRTQLLRQLRARRKGVAFSGEVERRERMLANLRQARLSGIRVRMPAAVVSARLAGLPEGVTVDPWPDRGAVHKREGSGCASLRTGAGADERLRAV